ncbi:hypothetical protein Bca101_026491 [Brassica carinata]
MSKRSYSEKFLLSHASYVTIPTLWVSSGAGVNARVELPQFIADVCGKIFTV